MSSSKHGPPAKSVRLLSFARSSVPLVRSEASSRSGRTQGLGNKGALVLPKCRHVDGPFGDRSEKDTCPIWPMGQVLVGWLGLLDVLQTSLIQTIGREKWKRRNGEKLRRPNSEDRKRVESRQLNC